MDLKWHAIQRKHLPKTFPEYFNVSSSYTSISSVICVYIFSRISTVQLYFIGDSYIASYCNIFINSLLQYSQFGVLVITIGLPFLSVKERYLDGPTSSGSGSPDPKRTRKRPVFLNKKGEQHDFFGDPPWSTPSLIGPLRLMMDFEEMINMNKTVMTMKRLRRNGTIDKKEDDKTVATRSFSICHQSIQFLWWSCCVRDECSNSQSCDPLECKLWQHLGGVCENVQNRHTVYWNS